MTIINAFSGVGVAGMARTLHVIAAHAAAAHAAAAHAAAAHPAVAAITPRKPRSATAIVAFVNRGPAS
jgi:hypothetical protein